jgi:hypothetical protein
VPRSAARTSTPEIKAGAGAIEDPLHPETAATEAAAELDIKGRSSMSADEKRKAIAKAEQGA